MPYILVRSLMQLTWPSWFQADHPFQRGTHIDCQDYQREGRSIIGDALSSVGAKLVNRQDTFELPEHPVPCAYRTDQPPQLVLDALERQGYNVVATNTVSPNTDDRFTENTVTCMWTLHKPASS